MKNRADEIRRKYQHHFKSQKPSSDNTFSDNRNYLDRGQSGHPLFSSEGFLFRIMAAVCLFLVVGIVFKNPTGPMVNAQDYINQAFEEEFQFASIAGWYEEKFGKPIALFPTEKKEKSDGTGTGALAEYALPANAKVLQSFKDNGKGVLLETGSNSDVSSIKEGFVIYVGDKDQLGKTVVVQHFDGSESWYGKLDKINESIKLYNYIDAGAQLGKVTKEEKTGSGLFYFAIKDNGGFVDPLKALSSD